jgi:hypothetical protein
MEVIAMSVQARYLKVLSKIIPAGAVSASLLLGSATPSEASLTDAQPSASASIRVSERLGAIREAVSEIMIGANIAPGGGETHLSWNNQPSGKWLNLSPPPKPLPKKDPHPFPRH